MWVIVISPDVTITLSALHYNTRYKARLLLKFVAIYASFPMSSMSDNTQGITEEVKKKKKKRERK
jgi:hypothetical protein